MFVRSLSCFADAYVAFLYLLLVSCVCWVLWFVVFLFVVSVWYCSICMCCEGLVFAVVDLFVVWVCVWVIACCVPLLWFVWLMFVLVMLVFFDVLCLVLYW